MNFLKGGFWSVRNLIYYHENGLGYMFVYIFCFILYDWLIGQIPEAGLSSITKYIFD